MTSVKDIEWNVGAVLATVAAISFLVVQVYVLSTYAIGLSMIGKLF